ncbi:hypothetical protein Q5P01_007733 [Channa striata]|uniref:PNPLA domain-containing protein n=1 Tax=Channa striata TaxID=64152 RepID=A0AA88SYX0_CHASR|nr:hypothetical protein Q5P01_007733 [Channa striata]
MTRLSDGKHTVMSEFQSKQDVVQALLCSCFVPGYCGIQAPSIKGVHYVDGGFSSMQPVLLSDTLTVSPFSGEVDICPTDTPCMWDIVVSGATLKGNVANSFRILNALYPIALETLEQAYHNGYKDAIKFLLQNDLAPYLTLQKYKLSNGPSICNETKTHVHLNATTGDDEEVKVEKEATTLTCFIKNKQSNEHELARNQPISEPTLHFDVVKNDLRGNVVTHMSMFGLPVRILAYLLLPLMLFYTALRSRYKLELLLHVTELAFCTWHGLRHFALFLCSIMVFSLKKNVNDRVIPIILFLQWLKTQAQDEAAPLTPNNL